MTSTCTSISAATAMLATSGAAKTTPLTARAAARIARCRRTTALTRQGPPVPVGTVSVAACGDCNVGREAVARAQVAVPATVLMTATPCTRRLGPLCPSHIRRVHMCPLVTVIVHHLARFAHVTALVGAHDGRVLAGRYTALVNLLAASWPRSSSLAPHHPRSSCRSKQCCSGTKAFCR